MSSRQTRGSKRERSRAGTRGQNGVSGMHARGRSDDGNAFKVPQVFKFEEMGGSVVEGLGESAKDKEKGNLAF